MPAQAVRPTLTSAPLNPNSAGGHHTSATMTGGLAGSRYASLLSKTGVTTMLRQNAINQRIADLTAIQALKGGPRPVVDSCTSQQTSVEELAKGMIENAEQQELAVKLEVERRQYVEKQRKDAATLERLRRQDHEEGLFAKEAAQKEAERASQGHKKAQLKEELLIESEQEPARQKQKREQKVYEEAVLAEAERKELERKKVAQLQTEQAAALESAKRELEREQADKQVELIARGEEPKREVQRCKKRIDELSQEQMDVQDKIAGLTVCLSELATTEEEEKEKLQEAHEQIASLRKEWDALIEALHSKRKEIDQRLKELRNSQAALAVAEVADTKLATVQTATYANTASNSRVISVETWVGQGHGTITSPKEPQDDLKLKEWPKPIPRPRGRK